MPTQTTSIQRPLVTTTYRLAASNPTGPMSHSFSRSWKAPAVVARERWARIAKSREHICPDSPFLTKAFKQTLHEQLFRQAKDSFTARKSASTAKDMLVLALYAKAMHRDLHTCTAFQGEPPNDSCAAVLAFDTIWTSRLDPDRPEAPWPSVSEAKHEGDERVQNGVNHRRFLPIPRYPPLNDVLSWSDLDFLPQHPMDQVGRLPEVGSASPLYAFELQISDLEGTVLLGEALMKDLDPIDIYF